MQIDPKLVTGTVSWVGPTAAARVASTGNDQVTLSGAAALEAAYQQTADVRPEAVARGQDALAIPDYPPQVIIQKLSKLLAMQLPKESS